jgi:hypothetical protein
MPKKEKREVPWTLAEDRMLLALAKRERDALDRPMWSVIGKKLNEAGFDRTPQQARCRHGRMERGKAQRAQGKARNYCNWCGQLRAGHVCTGKPAPAALDPDPAAAAAAAVATLYALARGV